MATITDTTTDANGNIIINVSSSADDAITLATAGTYSDKNIIFNIKTPQNSVQPDWNQNDETQPDYVKNRPFYTGDRVETVLIEETTAPFVDSTFGFYMAEVASTFAAIDGETYKVSWDGTVYECTCVFLNNMFIIGNQSIMGMGDDTGEPFIFGITNGHGTKISTLDTSAFHTFSIISSETAVPVVKIDEKYLPDTLLPFKPAGKSYLTFSSLSSFTLEVNDATKHWNGTLEYFTSDRTWATWYGTTILSAVADDGQYVLYLRGTGNTVITGSETNYKWVLTGTDIKCIGNIENLLDYATVESGGHPTMANYCYSHMFQDCINLTQAPALPATTLATGCYVGMFRNCTNLTQAPALPATTLVSSCYAYMFQDCTNLTQAPALPATTLAAQCYASMFRDCTNLTQAPALPATMLASSCYSYMFDGCTSLAQPPALPATKLDDNCYVRMFRNCISLTQVPALPATGLASGRYSGMFQGCTSLKLSSTKTDEYTQEYRIPFSGNGTGASNALEDMFTSTGGAFTGTPSINTTYYLSSDNMVVRETEIATLNGYVGSMIDAAVPELDTTLSITGKSADAKATGDAIRALSEEIVTTSESKVAAHNTGTDTHSDIRLLIQGLTDRLNALADSDDTTLDQMSEVVAYIKSNKNLIDAITTNKVSVADIVDNLTTNVSNKPLSAAQGVAIKTLIDALRNDKLDAAELTNAVNTALAQAKASGEFDGQDGKSAYQYAQESGYTKTEAEFAKKLASDDNFYIDLAGSDMNYTCPMTMDDIKAAYNAGYNLVCRCTLGAYTTTLPLFLPMPNANLWVFSGSGALNLGHTSFPPQSFTVAITGESVVAQFTEFATIYDMLPNPNALTFTGAVTGTYDGSNPVSVEIPSAVTDDHINSLIDAKLGGIENGSY